MIASGVFTPNAGMINSSGSRAIFLTGTVFTVKPLPVRTCFLSPTIVTVNGVGDAGTSCRRAFAVARMSTTAESPESKQPSTARTATSTSEMILNVAGPPLPISRLDTYGGDILGGSRR